MAIKLGSDKVWASPSTIIASPGATLVNLTVNNLTLHHKLGTVCIEDWKL